jgi:hypothetical protein
MDVMNFHSTPSLDIGHPDVAARNRPVAPKAPAKMGDTRVVLPCGGCASTNANEVRSPRLGWLAWAIGGGLLAAIILQRL